MSRTIMRILVCGSRHFQDYYLLCREMDKLDLDNKQPITIIEGGARGADRLGKQYAEECGWELEEYPADWDKYGKAAGPIRNQHMLDEGKPDMVIAFLAPNSRGTKDMISRAEKANIPVKVINI